MTVWDPLFSLLPNASIIKLVLFLALPVYLLSVRYFRNYRQRALERRFRHLLDDEGKIKPDAQLNPLDAQEIVWSTMFYEFPFSFTKARMSSFTTFDPFHNN